MACSFRWASPLQEVRAISGGSQMGNDTAHLAYAISIVGIRICAVPVR